MDTVNIKKSKYAFVDALVLTCSAEANSPLVDGKKIKKRINSFLEKSGLTKEEVSHVFMSPKEHLGEFSELPDVLQSSMAISAAFFDQEFCLTNLPKLRKFMLSPVWELGNTFISVGQVLSRNKKIPNPISLFVV